LTRAGRWALGAAVAALVALAGDAALREQRADAQRERGAALFRGDAALPGRVAGHDTALPALATRCSNCHEAPAAAPSALASAPYAAPLTAAHLMSLRVRRGGPATVYDAARLCALLRSGTDPAHVMIATTMPRYDITEAQCQDLWAHLVSR
jgi:hypothetical protein